ncbi:hypothetical protein, partial [Marivita sp.]|uniref:hypothetical protein n=1 Tax=Marivita sp. TaxID=2003365 RepID=UPI003219C8D4
DATVFEDLNGSVGKFIRDEYTGGHVSGPFEYRKKVREITHPTGNEWGGCARARTAFYQAA